jgi:predicted deacylase
MPSATRIVSEVPFDRYGKHHGFLRLFHSVHSSAYGFIPIPIVVVRNGEGPTALFVSGNHGDEYEGQVALSNLVRRLDPAHIRGRVILLPAANFPAVVAGKRTSPVDEGNLNRSFPGDPSGTVTQQIAYFVEHELVPMANLVCDLHSGGSSLMYLPSVLLPGYRADGGSEAGVAALKAFGAENAYATEINQGGNQTLAGACARAGVLSLGTEAGGSGHVTAIALRMVERGVTNLLVHMGILPEGDRVAPPGPTRYLEVGGADYFVYAPENGLYEPLVELGDTVMAGQPAARIHFPETPWAEPVLVSFRRSGIALCKRMPGRTMRGDCLFHLGTELAL